MREVRIVESLKYGGRTFLYFISTVLLGGGGIALGLAVGYSAATIRGTGGDPVVYDTPELIAGFVLGALGTAVLLTGLFGLIYKLVADAVTFSLAHTDAETTGTTQTEVTTETAAVTTAGPDATDSTSDTARSTPTVQATQTADTSAERADPGPAPSGAATTAQPEDTEATGGTSTTEATTQGNGYPGEAEGESAGDTAAETESEASPRASGSQSHRSDEAVTAQPEGQARAEQGPAAEDDAEEESTEWGPPGHTDAGEEEAPADEPSQRGDLSEAEIRERTAEEIAFGDDRAETEPTESDTDASPDESEQSAESDEEPADDETASEGPVIGGASDEESTEEDELARMFSDTESGEESEPDDGEADEEPLVPEYDEIPDETESADEDDPLGDPLEDG